jgi:hypothetical protein
LLINFRAGNFKSLRDPNELSLVVPTWADTHEDVTVPLPRQPGIRVGTVAAVFGANASGKSNVLEAIRAMRRAVVSSHQRWDPDGGAPHDPFLLDKDHLGQPTMFEVDLVIDEDRFNYGFCLDADGIASEWLYTYPQNRPRLLYSRNRDEGPEFRFGKSLTGQTAVLRELTRRNSLFLSVAAANNHPELSRIYHWFSRKIRVMSPEDDAVGTRFTLESLKDEGKAQRIRDLVRIADLGIVDVRLTHKDLPEETATFVKDIFERFPWSTESPPSFDDFMQFTRESVEMHHEIEEGARGVPIPFDLESRGTRNWFGLVGTLVSVLDTGGLLLVDELDSSLHPHLSEEILRMFHDPQVNSRGAQLVFTSHDPTLLGNLLGERPPLRRDEIWITEKDRDGATRIYSLTDFSPRKSENIERGYLQGRYGGVPFVDHERIRQPSS